MQKHRAISIIPECFFDVSGEWLPQESPTRFSFSRRQRVPL